MRGRTVRTPEKRAKFIKSLLKTGNISKACKAAGIGRSSAYEWKQEDSEFSIEWDDAEQEGLDNLESEAYRRAFKGVLKPVYQQGKKVGQIREYSDTLLIFLLKGGRPEKYRDRSNQLAGNNNGPIPVTPIDYRTAIAPLAPRSVGDSEPSSED